MRFHLRHASKPIEELVLLAKSWEGRIVVARDRLPLTVVRLTFVRDHLTWNRVRKKHLDT
jgi:hypothetical protein